MGSHSVRDRRKIEIVAEKNVNPKNIRPKRSVFSAWLLSLTVLAPAPLRVVRVHPKVPPPLSQVGMECPFDNETTM